MASYTLIIRDNSGQATTRRFEAERVTIGRKKGDIVLGDLSVSSRHAELQFDAEDGVLTYVDVGSSNGTWLPDGSRVQHPMSLEIGAVLLLGQCTIELQDLDVPDERTAMLSADEIQKVLSSVGGANAAPSAPVQPPRRASAPAQPPRRAAPPQANVGYPAEPAPPAAPAWEDPAPRRRQPAGGGYDDYAAPASGGGYDDYAAPAGAGGGGYDDYAAPQGGGAEPMAPTDDWAEQAAAAPEAADWPQQAAAAPEADDWAAAAAKEKPGRASKKKKAPKAPAPRRDGPRAAPATIEDESFAAFVPTLKGAVLGTIDFFKAWKEPEPPMPSWDGITAPLKGAWALLKEHLTAAPLPLVAVNGVLAIVSMLVMLLPSLGFVYSLFSLVGAVAAALADASIALYMIRVILGQPISIQDAVQACLRDPKTLLISLLSAMLVAAIGMIALIIPGLVLGAFIFPVYWVEGRGMLGINQRSMELFFKDGKRVLLSLLTCAVAGGVVSAIVTTILNLIPAVGPYLSIVFQAVWSGLLGAYFITLLLWLYFDIRANCEAGDALAEARERLV